MKRIGWCWIMLFFAIGGYAENGHSLWLRQKNPAPVSVSVSGGGSSETLSIAKDELQRGWQGKAGAAVKLVVGKSSGITGDGFRLSPGGVEAATELGILYGVYELLRRQQTGETIPTATSTPSYQHRVLNHWDNLDGSIERGYAGKSIFWRKNDPFTVTETDKTLWKEYARANASIGINGAVLNNVNASPLMLSTDYLNRVKAIANVLRPYGIRVYLSAKFSSPAQLGKLKTSDPLDPAVINWWAAKVKEVYGLIPDFGGFLIKANSEGQPGPQDYGRTHADGANMLADMVKPYGGIVMWRAFVYSPNDNDRARQAYKEFMPLDGQFRDNVIVQVKNGPIDFQPREPFSPLFGAMKKTPVMAEFQITQEYLGHATHLVFLSPMWQECLQSDTYQQGKGSTVARCTDGSIYPQKITAIAGVANVGLDTNWTGHDFAQANWYAFGRLAWSNSLTSEKIADEWLKLTFGGGAGTTVAATDKNWNQQFVAPVKKLMLDSREAAVNYMMPLGIHHIFAGDHHYGPGPWYAPNIRRDWTPPYYHQADSAGMGFNRTRSGSDAVSQYHEPLASQLNDVKTCPEIFLLYFHHLPWTYQLKSGRTLWDELCLHYDTGLKQVRAFGQTWDGVQPYVDAERFAAVQHKLQEQATNAQEWKDGCLLYFQQFSKRPLPAGVEPAVNKLSDLIRKDMRSPYDRE